MLSIETDFSLPRIGPYQTPTLNVKSESMSDHTQWVVPKEGGHVALINFTRDQEIVTILRDPGIKGVIVDTTIVAEVATAAYGRPKPGVAKNPK